MSMSIHGNIHFWSLRCFTDSRKTFSTIHNGDRSLKVCNKTWFFYIPNGFICSSVGMANVGVPLSIKSLLIPIQRQLLFLYVLAHVISLTERVKISLQIIFLAPTKGPVAMQRQHSSHRLIPEQAWHFLDDNANWVHRWTHQGPECRSASPAHPCRLSALLSGIRYLPYKCQ